MKINESGRLLVSLVLAVVSLLAMAVLMLIYGWLPEAQSTLSGAVDDVFYFVVATSVILTLGVVAAMMWLMYRYRRRTANDRSDEVKPNATLELAWVVLPTILVLVVFTWGFRSFVTVNVAPPNAYEIYVTGQKWFWEFEYPNGVTTANEFAVPVDRPVKLIMTSRDVLHSFFVPEFRVKHDVIPNRYTTVWFEATEESGNGDDDFVQVFCTEYCGTNHSKMGAELKVLAPGEFETWLAERNTGDMTPIELGSYLYSQKTCVACHSVDGSPGVGPTFLNLYGSTHGLADGSTVTVDEEYLRSSILQPMAQITEGYQPVMPVIPLEDDEVVALIEYIKSLE